MTRDEALVLLAGSPLLLMMCDYDGTLAPITSHPSLARPDATTLDILGRLIASTATTVAVVSGRRRADLEAFLPVAGLILVGGHGAETGGSVSLDDEEEELFSLLIAELEGIAAAHPGTLIEVKPTSAALHYRQMDGTEGDLVAKVMTGPARRPGVRVVVGKKVVELSVSHKDKGDAVRHLMEGHPGARACYIGDDLTDEDAFRALDDGDVGVKVGSGETAARVRLSRQAEVVPFLAELASARGSGS